MRNSKNYKYICSILEIANELLKEERKIEDALELAKAKKFKDEKKIKEITERNKTPLQHQISNIDKWVANSLKELNLPPDVFPRGEAGKSSGLSWGKYLYNFLIFKGGAKLGEDDLRDIMSDTYMKILMDVGGKGSFARLVPALSRQQEKINGEIAELEDQLTSQGTDEEKHWAESKLDELYKTKNEETKRYVSWWVTNWFAQKSEEVWRDRSALKRQINAPTGLSRAKREVYETKLKSLKEEISKLTNESDIKRVEKEISKLNEKLNIPQRVPLYKEGPEGEEQETPLGKFTSPEHAERIVNQYMEWLGENRRYYPELASKFDLVKEAVYLFLEPRPEQKSFPLQWYWKELNPQLADRYNEIEQEIEEVKGKIKSGEATSEELKILNESLENLKRSPESNIKYSQIASFLAKIADSFREGFFKEKKYLLQTLKENTFSIGSLEMKKKAVKVALILDVAISSQSIPPSDDWKQQFDKVEKCIYLIDKWVVVKDGKFGAYDSATNTVIIPLEYDWVYPAGFPNLWLIRKNNKYGVYNSVMDAWPILLEYDGVYPSHSPDIWKVGKGGKWGIYSSGMSSVLVPLEYDDVLPTDSTDVWHVKKDGKWCNYNSTTKVLSVRYSRIAEETATPDEWRNQYDWVQNTHTPYLKIVRKNGKFGVYNTTAKAMLIPLEYDRVEKTPYSEMWLVGKNNKYGIYYSGTGDMLIPIKYDYIKATESAKLWMVYENGAYHEYHCPMGPDRHLVYKDR